MKALNKDVWFQITLNNSKVMESVGIPLYNSAKKHCWTLELSMFEGIIVPIFSDIEEKFYP